MSHSRINFAWNWKIASIVFHILENLTIWWWNNYLTFAQNQFPDAMIYHWFQIENIILHTSFVNRKSGSSKMFAIPAGRPHRCRFTVAITGRTTNRRPRPCWRKNASWTTSYDGRRLRGGRLLPRLRPSGRRRWTDRALPTGHSTSGRLAARPAGAYNDLPHSATGDRWPTWTADVPRRCPPCRLSG